MANWTARDLNTNIQEQEDVLNKTPTFYDLANSSQVTISDANPNFFNFQDNTENKILEISKSPFLMKEETKVNKRYSNNKINRIRKVNLDALRKPNSEAGIPLNKDFQFNYFRYFKYKHMMKKLKKKIMNELSRNSEFNPTKQEVMVKKSCFKDFENKLSIVTDKLQYYTQKLKKAGVDVNNQEIEDLNKISPKFTKETIKPKKVFKNPNIKTFEKSLDISTRSKRRVKGKLRQKFRSLSTMPRLRSKKRCMRNFKLQKNSIGKEYP
ncbi:unnamed protein product [Moneuplotes crassus]|uniref:Uncharacterized protein n=1 Tax=Euplotes crassus TaxID=5936 RepID=A0AAD1UF23_EUPCR|nr:unnamed protein product [Moneuplotes crassus]